MIIPHFNHQLGKEPKSIKSIIMENIQKLIDEKGVISIPEEIVMKNAPIENGITYIPTKIGKSAFDNIHI